MITLLFLACAGPGDKTAPLDSSDMPPDESSPPADSGDSGDTGEPAFDPLALAAEVSEDELRVTIEALSAFETRHLQADNHDEVRAYLVERLEALEFTVEVDAFEVRGNPAGNVIARLDGADPSRVWVFQAHFDSTSELAPETAPGADDNASGVAAVIEAARVLREVPLSDSVWFILTDAEEQGSRGSAYLVEQLGAEGVSIQGVIAPDMIGYWPRMAGDAFDILGDEDSEHLVESMSEIADALGVANKTWVEHYYCYGDDHTNWQEAGFPAVAPMDCAEAHNVPDTEEGYGHYHLSTDTPDTLYLPFTTKVASVIVAALASWAG